MIDIHTHVLPAIDDGARNLDESLAMLRMAAAAGTTEIVATPHAGTSFPFDPGAVDGLMKELQAAAGPVPRLHYGCELRLTPETIEDALKSPARYAFAHGSAILVEFPDFVVPKSAGQILSAMLMRGIRPIIAHPERSSILRKQTTDLEDWVEQGCLLQVTTQSLDGRFGKSSRTSAHELLERGLVHFIASDSHDLNHRPPLLDQASAYISKVYGPDLARRIFIDNPKAALAGDPIAPIPAQATKKKSWFSFR